MHDFQDGHNNHLYGVLVLETSLQILTVHVINGNHFFKPEDITKSLFSNEDFKTFIQRSFR